MLPIQLVGSGFFHVVTPFEFQSYRYISRKGNEKRIQGKVSIRIIGESPCHYFSVILYR